MTGLPRAFAVPCTTVLVVGLATGCALNAGSEKAQRFEEDWRGTPDVADVRTDASNSLPFMGTARGTLVVAAGTSDERVAELFHELGEYVHAHGGVDGSLEVEHVTLDARSDRASNDAVLDLWLVLHDDPTVVEAQLGLTEVSVDLDDPARFAELVEDLATPGGDLEPLADTRVVVRADPLSAEVSAGHDPTAAIDAFRAVAAQYEVTEAHLRTSPEPRVELRVADSADITDAQALARTAAPGVAVVVEGGDVSFDGTDARESAHALDLARVLETRPDVAAVTVVEDGLEVRVLDIDAAVALEQDLADEPLAATLRSVVARNDDVDPDAPGPRVFRVVVGGQESGPLTAAEVRDVGAAVPSLARLAAVDRVGAELSGTPLTEGDVEALARELAVRVPAGTRVGVAAGRDFAVAFTAGPDPDPEEITYPTRIGGDVFYTAWRDAWP